MQRRRFIQAGAAALSGLFLAGCGDSDSASGGSNGDDDLREWVMPEEGDPHNRTWMAFGASEAIWGAALLPEVQRNLATIAQTIAQFEPVSMLVRFEELDLARSLVAHRSN